MGRGTGGKGAQRSGHSIGKGAKGNLGKGKDLANQRYFETNQQILQAAHDRTQFLSLLHQLSDYRVKLDIVNIVTILHRGGKLRLSLPTHVVRFLGATLNEAHCLGKFKPRGFVWL